tara:strand:- start:271 stop:510 length:240 start_codon:yes stop_codon:yes gene_type:complete
VVGTNIHNKLGEKIMRKKLTLAEQAISDKVWIQLNPLDQEILCIEMMDGRIIKQIIHRDHMGRLLVLHAKNYKSKGDQK